MPIDIGITVIGQLCLCRHGEDESQSGDRHILLFLRSLCYNIPSTTQKGAPMEAYTSFAQVYDTFMDNVPYEDWSDRIRTILRQYGITGGLALDLGCGTGKMTELLAEEMCIRDRDDGLHRMWRRRNGRRGRGSSCSEIRGDYGNDSPQRKSGDGDLL